MTKFLLCKHDYQKNISCVISSFDSPENARLALEETLDDIQVTIQGSTKYMKSNNVSHIGNLKYGMFVLTYKQIIDKFTVIERVRSEGIIYNSYNDKLICDLYIVTQNGIDREHSYVEEYVPGDEHQDKFSNVMVQLTEKKEVYDP